MTTSADHAKRNNSNRRTGSYFERRWLKRLQQYFPGADFTRRWHAGDFDGIGDLIMDTTTARWSVLGESDDAESSKIWQARRDAKETGYKRWVIIKRGGDDEGYSMFWLEDANTGLAAYAELLELREKAARLDQVTAEADEAYERGEVDGYRRAMKAMGAALRGETA